MPLPTHGVNVRRVSEAVRAAIVTDCPDVSLTETIGGITAILCALIAHVPAEDGEEVVWLLKSAIDYAEGAAEDAAEDLAAIVRAAGRKGGA